MTSAAAVSLGDQVSRLQLFNRTLLEFITDLCGVVVDPDPELRRQADMLGMMLNQDDSNPMFFTLAKHALTPELASRLKAHDDAVLLNHEFTTTLGRKVQHAFLHMDPANRAVVWQYVDVLLDVMREP